MDTWVFALLVMFGGVVLFILVGLPVALSFFAVNLVGSIIFLGGEAGIMQMIRNLRPAVGQYSLAPIPLFILMGEIMLQTGMAARSINAVDRLIARVPGRLSIVAILGGTSFATVSGSSLANTAVVGRTLLPKMRSHGYSPAIAIGPVAAVGGIAVLIPPSALAVMLASLAQISVKDLLIAGIIPGAVMIVLFLGYVLLRCSLNPSLAPSYEVEKQSWRQRAWPFLRDVMPLIGIFAVVVGSMLAGIATPTESAAVGVIAALAAAYFYRCLDFNNLIASFRESLKFSAMILFIIACSATFSQILSFSGATQTLTSIIVSDSGMSPTVLVLLMLALLIFLGLFMESASILMLTIPIFFPLLVAFDVNTLWFAVMMMVALEIGLCTPPFGMLLFVVKGVVGKFVGFGEICLSVLPFVALQLLVVAAIFAFPSLSTWLPSLLK